MDEILSDSMAEPRYQTMLLSLFGITALILAAVGVFAVTSYSVSQRTHEIGIRMALGATRASVYQLILKEAGWLTFIGLIIGVFGSIAAGMFMRSLLFGVRTWDVSTLAAVATVLVTCALFASYIPARRAASVDPLTALRHE